MLVNVSANENADIQKSAARPIYNSKAMLSFIYLPGWVQSSAYQRIIGSGVSLGGAQKGKPLHHQQDPPLFRGKNKLNEEAG